MFAGIDSTSWSSDSLNKFGSSTQVGKTEWRCWWWDRMSWIILSIERKFEYCGLNRRKKDQNDQWGHKLPTT